MAPRVHDAPLFTPLTAEQEAKIDELLRLARRKYDPVSPTLARFAVLCDDAAPTLRNNTRLWAHAFLVARQWDVQRALAMLDVVHAYRARNRLDDFVVLPSAYTIRGYDEAALRAELQLRERPRGRLDRVCAAVDAYLRSSIHYWDKDGLPVQYLCVGTIDERGLLKTLKRLAEVGQSMADVLWEYVQHCISIAELLGVYQQLRIRRGDLAGEGITDHNGLVRAMTIVVDVRGLNYTMLWKPALDLFKETLSRVFTYYPDCVHRFVVVNCPRMIMFAYSIVKNVFSADMQRKVSFYKPDETAAALSQIIARKYVPAALGGDCHCDDCCFSGDAARRDGKHSHDDDDGGGSRRNSTAGSLGHSHNGSMTSYNNNNGGGDDDDGGVCTEDVALRPGKACVKVFALTRGEKVVWEYATEHTKDIHFAMYFVPRDKLPAATAAALAAATTTAAAAATADNSTTSFASRDSDHHGSSSSNSNSKNSSSSSSRRRQHDDGATVAGLSASTLERVYTAYRLPVDVQGHHADTYAAPDDGALALVWNNKGSWLRSKTLQLRVYKERDDADDVHAVVRQSNDDADDAAAAGARGEGGSHATPHNNNNSSYGDSRRDEHGDDARTPATATLASARSSGSGQELHT